MKKLILSSGIIALMLLSVSWANAAIAYTFTSSGTWTCPNGVSSIQVECWGGGGAGGAANNNSSSGHNGGGGGGGGAYAITNVSVIAGNSYTITVGAGGTSVSGSSIAGSPSSFTGDNSFVISANGGTAGISETVTGSYGGGGAGGAANSSGTSHAGGAGAAAANSTDGGGGGSSAGPASNGSSGSGSTGGTAPAGGGDGGGGATSSASGTLGAFPGGGGGGAYSSSVTQRNGGAGGGGQVVITVAGGSFAYTPGSLVVLQPADPNANNTAFSILELSNTIPSQPFVYAIGIDGTSTSGLRMSGSAGTSGYLADSGDGTLLAFTGANTNITTTKVNSITNRGVGTLNAAGNYTLQTTYLYQNAVAVNAQPRGASTIDNSHWVIGDQSGVYTNLSSSAAPAGSFKAVKSFGGTNYVLGTNPVVMIFSGGTTNYMSGMPSDGNASDFYMISSGQNGSTYDVLYFIDNPSVSSGTIYKYAFTGGSWMAEGTYSTGLGGLGICAATNSSGVNLYFTTGDGATPGNQVVQLTDTASPLNSALTIAPASGITLYTAAAGQLLKGIAFAPVALAPSVSTQAANPTNATSATLNGNVIYDGGAALTDYGFYWGTTSPVTTSSTKAQVGTSDYSGAYNNNLTGLSVNTHYFYRAYADNSAGNTLGSSDVSFWTLANTPAAPTVGTPTTTSLNVAIGSGDGNPAATTYAIKETTSGEFVQSGGSLGVSPVFQIASAWGTKTVTGLNPSTTYTFDVEAQNGAGITTSFGTSANGTTSTPPTPTVSVTPDTLNFTPTLVSGTSANQTYSVSGINLTGNITITAPANFQVSTSSGSGFGSSVTLTPSGGTVASTNIYVRFQPTAQTSYSGNITDVSSGANNPNVAVSGIGATAPSVSTQAANPTNVTSATLNGTVTATNGALITDRGFYWSASPGVNTGTGTKLDEGGTTTGAYSKALTGLSANTVYYDRAYASNSVGFTLDSADVSFYTLAATPTAPTVGTPTATSLNVAIGSGDGNSSGTKYAIMETNSGNYVQSGGSLGGPAVFQTALAWGTKTVTGLGLGTQYSFEVMATNAVGIPTAFGPATSVYTANGPYTPGNIAVLESAVASANNTTFSILEVNPVTATLAQTVPINGTTGTNALRVSGSAGTAPKLADSGDGTLLVLAAFNSTNSVGAANNITNRAVATLDASNNFVLRTTYIGIAGNQVRNATTLDNKNWYVADAGGIYTNGDTAPLNSGKIQAVKSFGGTVYAVKQTGLFAVYTVSADGQTLTGLPGVVADTLATDFYMVASGNNGSTYDILYLLDDTSATVGTITKYSLVNGTWAANGTIDTSSLGGPALGGYCLAAALIGNSGANLYLTTGDGTVANNAVYQLTDDSGWNAGPNITTVTPLYTATGGATLKGVAFAPVNPLIVTNAADSGAGTLRTVISGAYSGAVIEFAPNLSGSTISLASTLTINTNLTIDASALSGGIQINGNHSAQVFNVDSGNNVVLNSLTITNGSAGLGGGIDNGGTLTVNQSTLSGNNAAEGAIYNGGTLTVNQSTLSRNTGGGIYNNNAGILTLNQSTLSGNTGNGILNSGTLTVFNSIVAGNAGASDIDNENNETIVGTNIVETLIDNGTTVNNGNILNAAPKLTALGNNGGPTQTMAPTNGSPAISACATAFTTDQRGFPRISLAPADIGAVGYGANPAGPGVLSSTAFNPVVYSYEFGFTNFTFVSFTVYANTDLTSPGTWVNLGPAVESPSGSGQYQFTDTPPASISNRFYRVTSP